MTPEESQNLKENSIIFFNAGGAIFGDSLIDVQYFKIKEIEDLESPEIPDPYWTPNKNFGPAKKIHLEHKGSNKKFYVIIPNNYEKENYVYFSPEDDSFGDCMMLETIKIYI